MSNTTKAPKDLISLFTAKYGTIVVIPLVTSMSWEDEPGESRLYVYSAGDKTILGSDEGKRFMEALSLYYEIKEGS